MLLLQAIYFKIHLLCLLKKYFYLFKKLQYIIFLIAMQFACQNNILAQVNILPEAIKNNLNFTENKGQWNKDIKFKYSSSAFHILIKDESISKSSRTSINPFFKAYYQTAPTNSFDIKNRAEYKLMTDNILHKRFLQ